MPAYSRLMDELGTLEHICNAFQPEIDDTLRALDQTPYIFDPLIADDRWLDWLQQIVGGGRAGDRWLGVGVNPEWPAIAKRNWIQRAWVYWQVKGTPWSLREAFAIWLRWEAAHQSDRFLIRWPLGRERTSTPPGWWDWYTPYGVERLQRWSEIQRFGSGDYPQIYRPDWKIATETDWEFGEPWQESGQIIKTADPMQSPGSAMGERSIWLHAYPDIADWNQVFPDAVELLPHAADALSRPSLFGWITGSGVDGIPVSIERDPIHPATEVIIQQEIAQGYEWGLSWPILNPAIDCSPGVTVSTGDGDLQLCNIPMQWSDRTLHLDTIERTITLTGGDYLEVYPVLRRALDAGNWNLLVESEGDVFVVQPKTMFWMKTNGDRSLVYEPGGQQRLQVEFLLSMDRARSLQSYTLILKEEADQSLGQRIDLGQINNDLDALGQWFSLYRRNNAPYAITSDGIAWGQRTEDEIPLLGSVASVQLRLMMACANLYLATNRIDYRQLAIALGEGLVNFFYRSSPLQDTVWLPQWLVNSGETSVAEWEVFYEQPVMFVNGIATLPETLAKVYRVYEGELRNRTPDAELIRGSVYEIDYWVDVNGHTQISLESPPANVEDQGFGAILLESREARLSFITTFSLALL